MIKLTAEEVYNWLLNKDKILTLEGLINFHLGDVDIIVKQRDVVGNLIQEWVEGWLRKNEIVFAPSNNTQMPPDFYLDPDDKTKDLLEIKAYNNSASPGFDIADFKSFQSEIISKPYMLNAKYLIFSYHMSKDGIVTIKKLCLKNVWEICRPSKKWSINVQFKNGMVHKIRPAAWYSKGKAKYLPFENLVDFLSAIEETVYKNPETRDQAVDWKSKMENSYKDFYKEEISIPRWMDIKNKYIKE